MSANVYLRAHLEEVQISAVQRQQFAPTTEKHQEYYSSQQTTLYHLFEADKSVEEATSIEDFLRPMSNDKSTAKRRPLDDLAILKNGFQLTKRQLGTIISATNKDGMRSTAEAEMVNQYLKMTCQYINTIRNKEIAMKSPSCVTITWEQYHALSRGRIRGRAEPLSIQTLRNLGFNSYYAFMEMDYLLVPYVQYGHSVLLGIAPKQRFVFVIDSIPDRYDSKSDIIDGITSLLLTLIPDFGYAQDPTQAKPQDWTVFGQWSSRSKTTDGSPDGPQQKDLYNCGVFTCTTAFCLAFGFDVNCYVEADLNKFKKPRMVAEFVNGGFFGEGFNYDALDFPHYRAPARDQAESSRKASASTSTLQSNPRQASSSTSMPRQSSIRQTPAQHRTMSGSIKRMLSVRKRRHDDDDNRDQRGFGDEQVEEGSDGESDEEEALDFKKEPLYTPQQLAHAMNLLPYNSTTKRLNRIPFPPQLDPKIHQQATLIFGGVPEGFNIQLRKYSKRELKQACRDFQVENWQPWSFERQGFFMKWVLNEISGIMARRRGDAVKPFDGVGEVEVLKVETAPIRALPRRASKRQKMDVSYVETTLTGRTRR